MVRLNPALADRLTVVASAGRIVDETSNSFYAVVASDAEGALGLNPSGGYIDKLLTQPDRELYDALRTGLGARPSRCSLSPRRPRPIPTGSPPRNVGGPNGWPRTPPSNPNVSS